MKYLIDHHSQNKIIIHAEWMQRPFNASSLTE